MQNIKWTPASTPLPFDTITPEHSRTAILWQLVPEALIIDRVELAEASRELRADPEAAARHLIIAVGFALCGWRDGNGRRAR